MKSKLLKFIAPIASLILLVLIMASGTVTAAYAESHVDEDGTTMIDTNWWFENVDVKIDVRTDKTLAVTETMKIGYIRGGENTGIIRDIQRVSQTTRIVGGERIKGSEYIANLSDVEVTINGSAAKVTRSLYEQGQFHSIKMQLPDGAYFPATDQSDPSTLNTFVLSYVYDMGDDKVKGFDDFTFDVLGYAMDYTRSFHALITFPTQIEADSVSLRTNGMRPFEPDADSGESVTVDGNVVEVYAKPCKEKVGYTVQVLFDDGYFSVKHRIIWYYFVFLALALASMVIGAVIFLKFSTGKPVEQVEFYPPENFKRALRFSALWNGTVKGKDIAAVITQWADEGVVEIFPDGKKDLIVCKKKDLSEDASKAERAYFNTMFKHGSEFSTRAQILSSDTRLSRAYESLKSEAETPRTLHKNINKAHIALVACMIFPFYALFIYYCILCSNALPLFFLLFITAGALPGAVQARERTTIIMYIFPIAFTAMPLFAFGMIFYIPLYDYAKLIFIAPLWYAVLYILSHFLRRRATEYERDYGRMIGFKNFLLYAELDRIEAMFESDPEYFSHVIPFCLIMGISDKVEKRFESLGFEMPAWSNGISAAAFSGFSHSLASSSGGGSSGGGGGGHGGSSGGGGGGGGSRGC